MLSTKAIVLVGAGIVTATGLALVGASIAGADQVTAAAEGYGYPRTAPPTGEGGYGQPPGHGQHGAPNSNTNPSAPLRSDEQLLTGDTAAKVAAAAKAKEPTATIERVETDSDGVDEAHMVRSDGTHIIVQVGADFQVMNVIEGNAGGQGSQSAGQPPMGGPPASGNQESGTRPASGSASS